ncbi:hypothetical protein [Pedococcus sp. P5_B7]
MTAAPSLHPGSTGTVEVLREIDELLDRHTGTSCSTATPAETWSGPRPPAPPWGRWTG